jgi:hypothetical protein
MIIVLAEWLSFCPWLLLSIIKEWTKKSGALFCSLPNPYTKLAIKLSFRANFSVS